MTSQYQQGDVLMQIDESLFNISISDGIAEMSPNLNNMVLLALSGGNIADKATEATKKYEWMGNEGESEQSKLRSRFWSTLNGLPLTSGNLVTLQDAAIFDITQTFSSLLLNLSVTISIVAKNSVLVTSVIELTSGVSATVKTELEKI